MMLHPSDYIVTLNQYCYVSPDIIDTLEALVNPFSNAKTKNRPTLIEVRARAGNREYIGDPITKPAEKKLANRIFKGIVCPW